MFTHYSTFITRQISSPLTPSKARWTSLASRRSIAAEAADLSIALLCCDLIGVDLLDRSASPSVRKPKHEGAVERRKLPRYEVQLTVLFNGDRGGSGTIQDLSVNGCLIVSDTPVEPGDYLCLWLYLPHDASPIVIEGAEVRWSADERFGVCFLTLQPEEQIRLFEYFNTIATT